MNRGAIKLSVSLMIFIMSFSLWAQNTINSVRVWPSPDSTRVVFDLSLIHI